MNAAITFEHFEDAIRALYGQAGPNQQRLANEYLIHVWNHCKQSWEYGLRILSRPVLPGQADATHTQYFCANMIYGKIRQEWFALSQPEQDSIQSELERLLQRIRASELSFAPLVLKRICMAMTVLYLAIDGGCARCVSDCVSTVSSLLHVQVALVLLTSLCDENDDSYLPPSRKDTLVLEITDASTKVFPFITQLFDSAAVDQDVRLAGLMCLKVWIKAAGFSLAKLYTNMPTVFHALLQAFQQPQTAPVALKEVVVCALILSDALEVNEYPPATSKEVAMQALAQTLLASHATIGFYLAHDANVAHALTTLVSTYGESELDWFVLGSPDALQLTELLLALASQPNRQIASLTFDFWLGIQDYPVASRHVAFQDAMFHRLLHALVTQCALRDDEDTDDVDSFRQAVAEVLMAIYHLLKAQFLVDMGQHIGGGGDAATVEAVMFGLTVVAPELKLKLVDDVASQQLVLEFCGSYVFQHPSFTGVPSVVKAASVFLGHLGTFVHAQWTVSQDDSLLVAALQYLSFALSVPDASASAAKAINLLCAACTTPLVLKDALVSTLLQSMQSQIGHLTLDERVWLLEGIVRVACLAPWGRLALEQLLAPICTRLLSDSRGDVAAVAAACVLDLQSLSTVLRFMDAPSDVAGGAALTQQVVAWSWPALQHVAASASSTDSQIRDALLDVFASVLKAKKQDAHAFASTGEFAAIVAWVETHAVSTPAAIYGAIVVVELYGAAAPHFVTPMIVHIGRAVMAHCHTVPSPTHVPDLIRVYFELAQRCVIFSPASLFDDAATFVASVHLAVACLSSLAHREALRAVVVYVNYLVTKRDGPTLAPFRALLDGALVDQKAPFAFALVQLVTATCPSTVLAAVTTLFFHVLSTYGAMHAAVWEALVAIESPLTVEDKRAVHSCWIRLTTDYAERKFAALMKDYAKVCRKEMPTEQLIDYFVDN
ncbi:Aste57867_22242 [Aphanomyces stellatus]|uniref:Aste57867_22242 protein n=1 Tax=Aphanomyces stellatus TaxID=120398 RepID=A0A485LJX0_9STRA|nr:hypothetical protein As57867_022173 [Aphanomyces stellatus]VFT98909.1 Aste57867_22242 [Aphanomyces stellatus]